MVKKKKEISFVERMLLYHRAGFSHKGAGASIDKIEYDELDDLTERIKKILEISERNHLNPSNMLFFVMYDIENNKVRTLIAKYLQKEGCQRGLKSIFFADTARNIYDEIKQDLQQVQETYENSDSIFLIPISTDQLRAMKVIGHNVDFDVVIKNKNTFFF